jgi:hypothetical protein
MSPPPMSNSACAFSPYICMKSAKAGWVRIGTWPKKSWNMSGSTM